MGMRSVTLPEYLAWRDRTQGGMDTLQVKYILKQTLPDGEIKTCLVGTIPIQAEHEQKVKNRFYSSTVLAALDSLNFQQLMREQYEKETQKEAAIEEAVHVEGDTAFLSLRPPVFQVTAIETLDDGKYIVYVEGRV